MRPRTDRVRQQAHASSGRVGVIAALVLLGVIAFFAWKGSERPVQEGGLSTAEQYEADGRIAPLLVNVLIFLSLVMTPLLREIPMAVLYGLFLYLGITGLATSQF